MKTKAHFDTQYEMNLRSIRAYAPEATKEDILKRIVDQVREDCIANGDTLAVTEATQQFAAARFEEIWQRVEHAHN